MGTRIHVVKRHVEYGDSGAFNYGTDDFKDLLLEAGANVETQDGNDIDFECLEDDYKTAIKVVACLANRKADDPYRVALFKELNICTETLVQTIHACWKNDYDESHVEYDEVKATKYVLSYMVAFYVQRDRNSGYVSFSAF